MAHEEVSDMLISAVAILGLVTLVAGILWIIYRIADKAFLKERSGQGTVIRKKLGRPHTSVTMQSHKVRYSNSWRLMVSIEDKEGWISIGQGSVEQFRTGDPVLVTYSVGRLSGDVHLFDIRKETGKE